jgi:peptide deformylase
MPDDLILQWGNPALRESAPPVAAFDEILRAQAHRLSRTLQAADGAGLAATQVGSLRRMFAFRLSPEDGIQIMVNPRVTWRSPEQAVFQEGCLSFNTVLVAVRRPYAVRVAGYDLRGKPFEIEGEDFAASLLQHEIDHLDGILTLHRADPVERYRAITALLAHDAPTRRAA